MGRPPDLPVFERPEWMGLANCRGMDTDLFFPERGQSRGRMDDVRAVCAVCEVQAECLDYGLREKFGIWGGLGERTRRRLRRASA